MLGLTPAQPSRLMPGCPAGDRATSQLSNKGTDGCIGSLELMSFVRFRALRSFDGSAGVVLSRRQLGALVGRVPFLKYVLSAPALI